jgi:Transposase DDE domain
MSAKKAANPKLQAHAQSFLDSLRAFLTPAIWKQANHARSCRRKSSRWETQPLVLALLVMTWCCGDSQSERFETAKGFTAVCLAKRRRPGDSVQGFQKALAKLPTRVLRVVAAGIRRRMLELLDLLSNRFIAFGCDGSSMETPNAVELEQRLDQPLKKQARPQVWVTALVHLRTGLLWSWRLGKGYSRERDHLRLLLPTLPAAALVVADAGFNGYGLAQAITAAGVSFLIRMSGKDRLYTAEHIALRRFREGVVFLWPKEAQKNNLPPLRVRLLRIRADQKRDVWLLTNVMDAQHLTVSLAARYYRCAGKTKACSARSSTRWRKCGSPAARCARSIARRKVRCWRRSCCWPKGSMGCVRVRAQRPGVAVRARCSW